MQSELPRSHSATNPAALKTASRRPWQQQRPIVGRFSLPKFACAAHTLLPPHTSPTAFHSCLLGPPAFLAHPTAIPIIGAAPASMNFPVACSQVLGTGTGEAHGKGINFHRRWSPLDIGAASFNDGMHGAPLPPYPIPRARPCKPIPHTCAIVLCAPPPLAGLRRWFRVRQRIFRPGGRCPSCGGGRRRSGRQPTCRRARDGPSSDLAPIAFSSAPSRLLIGRRSAAVWRRRPPPSRPAAPAGRCGHGARRPGRWRAAAAASGAWRRVRVSLRVRRLDALRRGREHGR